MRREVKMSYLSEVMQVVEDLNELVPTEDYEAGLCFSFYTNSYCYCILFNDVVLYDSDNEEREWDNEKCDYSCSIKDYAINQFKSHVKRTKNILKSISQKVKV